MINIIYNEAIKNTYYNNLSCQKFKRHNNQTLEEIYQKEFQEKLGMNLYGLLCGEFNDISNIKVSGMDHDKVSDIFNYPRKFQKTITNFFIENIEIHTCYFCNIDFINVFKVNDHKIKAGFTLDHFLNKSKNPHLALSLNNLVPACYTCNSKIKLSKNINSQPPTSKNFKFDEKVRFKTLLNSDSLLSYTPSSFDILLKEDFSNEYTDYINILQLNQRYQYHKQKIIDIIEKRKAYPDTRIKELAKLTNKTENEVKRDLFGGYTEEHLHKTSLSKLIKDVLNEIGININ
jgi:hypothetical protein